MELNKTTILYALIILAIVILAVAIYLYGFDDASLTRGTIKVWGFDKKEIYRDTILKSFKKNYPNINIEYTQKSPENYERELLNALASGNGPDIFPIHHTWISRYQDKITPLPSDLMSLKEYHDNFVDVASLDFVVDGSIWAIPFYVDNLALYWNKDLFNTAGIPEPPKTWNGFVETVARLTIKDQEGKIVRSGAALGTSYNVDFSSDILSLLMLQNGTTMIDDRTGDATFNERVFADNQYYRPGADALRFYTDFANPRKNAYSWNVRMPNSLEAFLNGETAMILAYASTMDEITSKAPYLNFDVAPMPQIGSGEIAVNYADYWGFVVWSASKNTRQAWQFLLWRAQPENLSQYLQIVKKPTSRRDLVDWQKTDPFLNVFVLQSLSARSWRQIDNLAIKDIFERMIDSVVLGQATVEEAIERGANQLDAVTQDISGGDSSSRQQYTPQLP